MGLLDLMHVFWPVRVISAVSSIDPTDIRPHAKMDRLVSSFVLHRFAN